MLTAATGAIVLVRIAGVVTPVERGAITAEPEIIGAPIAGAASAMTGVEPVETIAATVGTTAATVETIAATAGTTAGTAAGPTAVGSATIAGTDGSAARVAP